GERAAGFAVLVLAFTETFVRYQARIRLDGALTLAFTGCVALIYFAKGPRSWLFAGLVAGLGCLIKGPPALGAPIAGLLLAERRPAPGELALLAVTALLPPALFLAAD